MLFVSNHKTHVVFTPRLQFLPRQDLEFVVNDSASRSTAWVFARRIESLGGVVEGKFQSVEASTFVLIGFKHEVEGLANVDVEEGTGDWKRATWSC